MKWTRFKQEFAKEGNLYKYEDINNLKAVPKTKLWISKNQNPSIDKCFRIYTDPDTLYRLMPPLTKNPELYHVWDYHGNDHEPLPKEYFNKDYFKLNRIDKNKEIHCLNPEEQKEVVNNLTKNKNGEYEYKYFGLNHPYEIFIGGWVHFYDEEVRHGETDHAIYFDWNLAEGKESVTIYIYQTKPKSKKHFYVKVYPPNSQDPPPPKNPPPPCAQPS